METPEDQVPSTTQDDPRPAQNGDDHEPVDPAQQKSKAALERKSSKSRLSKQSEIEEEEEEGEQVAPSSDPETAPGEQVPSSWAFTAWSHPCSIAGTDLRISVVESYLILMVIWLNALVNWLTQTIAICYLHLHVFCVSGMSCLKYNLIVIWHFVERMSVLLCNLTAWIIQ